MTLASLQSCSCFVQVGIFGIWLFGFLPLANEVGEGNVFSVSVCLPVCPWGVPCDQYPWCVGPHVQAPTTRHHTRQGSPDMGLHWAGIPLPASALPLDMGPHQTGIPSLANDIWQPSSDLFKSVHFKDSLQPGADIWWAPRHAHPAQADGMHPTGMLSCD